jgi:hypothetical protein
MKEHEHATQNKPESKPAQDEVAKQANAEGKTPHAAPDHPDHQDHHAHMAAGRFLKDFSRNSNLAGEVVPGSISTFILFDADLGARQRQAFGVAEHKRFLVAKRVVAQTERDLDAATHAENTKQEAR